MNRLFIAFFIALLSLSARADFTCSIITDSLKYTIPLSGTVSMGIDSPNGTVIYKGLINQSSSPRYACSTGTQWLDQQFLKILSTPTSLSTWSGSPFPGAIYNTNVPGVGIALWSQLNPVNAATMANPALVWSGTRINQINIPVTLTLGYSLIKIGNISPGTVSGVSLPTFGIYLNITPAPNSAQFPWQATTYNFSGGINVVANTCETPDVNVDMGKWDVSEFGSLGKATKWIKSNITLKNCTTFSGYYSSNAVNNFTNGSVSTPNRDANTISVSLAPVTQLIDATNGIMAINSGPSTASGIGIQLGWGDFNTTPTIINFNQNKSINPPTNGVASFDIPLSARYIQTTSVVTPGRADGKVTFTINYH